MSKKSTYRARMLRTHGHLYKRTPNCNLDKCRYCDDLRQCLDHCPPLCYTETLDLQTFKEAGGTLSLIPSCHECNTILGDKPLFTIEERLSHLHNQYMRKINKFYTEWTQEEIDELGPTLQRSVLVKQKIVSNWIEKATNVETNILNLE